MKEIIEYFAKYNATANDEMLTIIEHSIPDPLNMPLKGYFFKTLGQLLEHIYLSDRRLIQMFLALDTYGIEIDKEAGTIYENSHPLFLSFSDYKEKRKNMDRFFVHYSSSIKEEDLFKMTTRINRKGEQQIKVAWKAWMHLFNHQTHHRGQISNILDDMQIENNFSIMLSVE